MPKTPCASGTRPRAALSGSIRACMTSSARFAAQPHSAAPGVASDRDRCLRMYSRPQVIEDYAQDDALQPPERGILDALGDAMAAMTMLDIGVGAGRLTAYFAPRVKDYRGIDLAPEMVAYCRRRFAGRIGPEKFSVQD